MGEITRSSLAAAALWWLEHPEIPRDVLVRVLLRTVQGLIGAVTEIEEQT
jgi:hypothetical protein